MAGSGSGWMRLGFGDKSHKKVLIVTSGKMSIERLNGGMNHFRLLSGGTGAQVKFLFSLILTKFFLVRGGRMEDCVSELDSPVSGSSGRYQSGVTCSDDTNHFVVVTSFLT